MVELVVARDGVAKQAPCLETLLEEGVRRLLVCQVMHLHRESDTTAQLTQSAFVK